MTTPESPDNGVLALVPPRVLLATQPVVGAHVGLSLASYDLIPDGEGATVEVDPPLSGTIEPGDVIWLWLLGDATFLSSVFITDVDAKTRLRIPKGRLHPDQFNELFYTITRDSSNVGKSEPNLTVLYNKIRPGLKDRFPEIDGHSELALLLPDAIKNGVGADFVSAQVCVSYPYCRAYDTITLKCNGESLTYKVRPDEAPQPPNPGSPNPVAVCFTVTRAFLESAVRPGSKLNFSVTVTDQVGNTPDTDAVWSATQTVDEDLAGTQLPAALLREQLNDPGDDLSIIDREKLRGNPLLLIILTADARFQVGYTVNALYTATLNGQPDVIVRVSGTIEADEFGQKKICVLEVANDKVETGRTVTVTYELFNGPTLVSRSKTATARVVGEATIELERPSIQQAPNNTSLDPFAAQFALTALIPPEGLLPTDLLSVTWTGAPGTPGEGSHTTEPRPISEIGLSIALPVTVIPFSLGKLVTVRYTVIRGGTSTDSASLSLLVQAIPDQDANLPIPAIDRMSGDDLDLSKLVDSASTRIAKWPLIALGQKLWLRYTGTKTDNSPYTESTYVATPVPADGLPAGMRPYAPVAALRGLKDGSELTIEFKVTFNGSINESQAVTFPLGKYIVKSSSSIEGFETVPIQAITIGQSIETPTMVISMITSTGFLNIQVTHISHEAYIGRIVFLPINGRTRFELKRACRQVSFWHNAVDVPGPHNKVFFYDEDNNLLHSEELKSSSRIPVQVTYSSSRIKRVEFSSAERYGIDYFILEA